MRGYRNKNILKYQLMRMNIWASMFCMGNPNKVLPNQLFKLYFDEDDYMDNTPLTDEDRKMLQAEMDAINRQLQQQKESSEE